MRRNLNHIRSNEIQAVETAHDLHCLTGLQAADLGRTGARSKAGVEAIDIKRKIDWTFADNLARDLDPLEVEIAISSSNQATLGHSVHAALLSYAGKPIRIRRFGTEQEIAGLEDFVEQPAQILWSERVNSVGNAEGGRLGATQDPAHRGRLSRATRRGPP